MLRLHTVRAGRYVSDETSPRQCWVLHDSDMLVNILYPEGAAAAWSSGAEGGRRVKGIDGEKGVSVMLSI